MAADKEMGRLAFREEGRNWVAYYATTDSMVGAIFLGSIAMKLVQNKKRRNEFIELMKHCFADAAEELFGSRPVWRKPRPAPEHERSRRA